MFCRCVPGGMPTRRTASHGAGTSAPSWRVDRGSAVSSRHTSRSRHTTELVGSVAGPTHALETVVSAACRVEVISDDFDARPESDLSRWDDAWRLMGRRVGQLREIEAAQVKEDGESTLSLHCTCPTRALPRACQRKERRRAGHRHPPPRSASIGRLEDPVMTGRVGAVWRHQRKALTRAKTVDPANPARRRTPLAGLVTGRALAPDASGVNGELNRSTVGSHRAHRRRDAEERSGSFRQGLADTPRTAAVSGSPQTFADSVANTRRRARQGGREVRAVACSNCREHLKRPTNVVAGHEGSTPHAQQ